ncbi:MAG TPA: cyclic-di-AMP receptor [Candidatus Limnocylindrales bacterium]|nr:cyclic-di-AMP receptor [Candidatus Limnocylindrales bacterium]
MSKLLVAIVHELDADQVITALEADGHRVTQLQSTGGYLRMSNSTLMLGLEDGAVPAVLAILERECSSREIELPPVLLGRLEDLPAHVRHGSATVFLSDLEAILRI